MYCQQRASILPFTLVSWFGRYQPRPGPRWRVAPDQDGVVACAERAAQPRVVEPQRLFRGPANTRKPDDEQVLVQKDEVVPPAVTARIEQAVSTTANLSRNLLPLGYVAERATPGEVVNMVRAASSSRSHAPETTGAVVRPQNGPDDVIDMELAGSRQ